MFNEQLFINSPVFTGLTALVFTCVLLGFVILMERIIR